MLSKYRVLSHRAPRIVNRIPHAVVIDAGDAAIHVWAGADPAETLRFVLAEFRRAQEHELARLRAATVPMVGQVD